MPDMVSAATHARTQRPDDQPDLLSDDVFRHLVARYELATAKFAETKATFRSLVAAHRENTARRERRLSEPPIAFMSNAMEDARLARIDEVLREFEQRTGRAS